MRLVAIAACGFVSFAFGAPQEHYAQLNNNLRVRYLTEGKGPMAMVLIHGWTCSAAFWRLQSADFARLYRVISIDLPGHGKSDKPENVQYSVPLFAQAIDAVMRDAHVTRAIIAGHSLGVPVAAQAIVDHPEKFAGFIAVDGAVWRPRTEATKPRTGPTFAQRLRADYIVTASVNLDAMFVPATPDDLREEIRERMLMTPVYVAASASENISASDVWSHVPLTLPTMAVVGGKQRDDDRRALYQEYFPNLRFELWEEAGHFLMMEQPARFNQLVMEFAFKVSSLGK